MLMFVVVQECWGKLLITTNSCPRDAKACRRVLKTAKWLLDKVGPTARVLLRNVRRHNKQREHRQITDFIFFRIITKRETIADESELNNYTTTVLLTFMFKRSKKTPMPLQNLRNYHKNGGKATAIDKYGLTASIKINAY